MSLTDEQLAERTKGLGGTDIAAILGLNDYRGPHDVYNDKRGLVEPFAGNKFTEFGNRMEPVIFQWYVEKRGDRWATANDQQFIHPEHKWMRGIPDGIIYDKNDKPQGIVEIKTANWRQADKWGPEGTDVIPEAYLIQVAWYMAILDVDYTDVVVLLDREFQTYRINRSIPLENELIAAGKAFWEDHVLAGVPPELDGSEDCYEGLQHGAANEGEIESTDEIDQIAKDYRLVKERLAKWEKTEKFMRNKLADKIGDNAKKVRGDWGSATWVHVKGSVKTNWEAVAAELKPDDEVLARHTRTTNRKPYFKATFKKVAKTEEGEDD